jgi:DNA-binding LytR/AlgR family response regulator
MINAIAIDDEPLALDIIENYCGRSTEITLLRTFTDTSEAARFLRKFPVDLLFLDIQMPDQNGIEFYREHGDGRMVIFTTAFSEYAVEGFNVNAIDYLLKPVEFSRFRTAIEKAVEYFNYTHASEQEQHRYLYVRSEYSLVKIPFQNISYIETLDDYIKIHLADRKPVLTKMNLKNVMSKLDPREFVRVHRSYIVPLGKIVSVRNKSINLGTIEIPIGAKFEEEFFSVYKA